METTTIAPGGKNPLLFDLLLPPLVHYGRWGVLLIASIIRDTFRSIQERSHILIGIVQNTFFLFFPCFLPSSVLVHGVGVPLLISGRAQISVRWPIPFASGRNIFVRRVVKVVDGFFDLADHRG